VWRDWSEIKRLASIDAGFLFASVEDRAVLERGFKETMHMSIENVNLHATLTLDKKPLHATVSLNTQQSKFKFIVQTPEGNRLTQAQVARVKARMACADCGSDIFFTLAAKHFTRDTPFCRACQKRVLHRCESYQRTYEASFVRTHGCRRPLQSPEIRKRMQATMSERHGASFSAQSPLIEGKRKLTMIEKYGRANFWTGINIWRITGLRPAKVGRVSNIERDVVEALIQALPEDKTYSHKNGQKRFHCGDGVAFLDYYNETRGVAVEVHGDYFHANPELFKPDHITYYGRRAQDIWERDAKRIETARQTLGATVMVVWESAWNRDKGEVLKDLIREMTK
jgi:ribosomal protein L33